MCDKCKDQTSDAFVRGIATIFWASAWADHVDEHQCRELGGSEITECMPEIPEPAWRAAERFAGAVEGANGTSLAVLLSHAMRAAGRTLEHEDYWGDDAQRFGECLAYMGMGDGVSWYDDHPEFEVEGRKMRVPHVETLELQALAGDQCEDA